MRFPSFSIKWLEQYFALFMFYMESNWISKFLESYTDVSSISNRLRKFCFIADFRNHIAL